MGCVAAFAVRGAGRTRSRCPGKPSLTYMSPLYGGGSSRLGRSSVLCGLPVGCQNRDMRNDVSAITPPFSLPVGANEQSEIG